MLASFPPVKVKESVAKTRLTLCDPEDCSPSGSSVRGILQARIRGGQKRWLLESELSAYREQSGMLASAQAPSFLGTYFVY